MLFVAGDGINSLTMAEKNRCPLATGVRAEDVGEEKIWFRTYIAMCQCTGSFLRAYKKKKKFQYRLVFYKT